MHTINHTEILGDVTQILPRIFKIAADIENWPRILPHYRYMRILEESATHKLADFGASRDGIPVSWQARQELFPEELRITFVHTGGVTKGMWVEWRLEALSSSVLVTIDHELHFAMPVLGPFVDSYVIGNLFVSNIANKTLRCIKSLVEAEKPD